MASCPGDFLSDAGLYPWPQHWGIQRHDQCLSPGNFAFVKNGWNRTTGYFHGEKGEHDYLNHGMEGFISKQGSWWWPADTLDSSLRLVEATDQSTICFKAVWSFIFHIPRLIHLIWDDNPKKTPNCQGGGSLYPENDRHIRFVSFSNEQLSVWNWGIRLAGNVILRQISRGFLPHFQRNQRNWRLFFPRQVTVSRWVAVPRCEGLPMATRSPAAWPDEATKRGEFVLLHQRLREGKAMAKSWEFLGIHAAGAGDPGELGSWIWLKNTKEY